MPSSERLLGSRPGWSVSAEFYSARDVPLTPASRGRKRDRWMPLSRRLRTPVLRANPRWISRVKVFARHRRTSLVPVSATRCVMLSRQYSRKVLNPGRRLRSIKGGGTSKSFNF